MTRKILTGLLLTLLFYVQASAQKAPLPFGNYISARGGLANTQYAINTQKELTVAFLGGSITYNPGWRQIVCGYLTDRFPKTKFKFIAAGIPSLGSLPHAFRFQRDVLDSGKVDLLFLEAAVNDQVNGTDSLTQVKSLEGIVRHALKSNPYMDIIMMSFADQDKTNIYKKGNVPTSVANHELVAGHYNLPSINLAKAVADKLANHEFSWEKDFKDLHPAPFGQRLYFEAMKTLLADQLNADKQTSKPVKHDLSKIKMLNTSSFTNGTYLDITNAQPDTNWTLDKSWTPSDKLDTRPGFVKVPMLVTTKPGSSLTLKFNGNAVGMALISGADAGIVDYAIDGGVVKHIDLFTQWSTFIHLPWYILFDSGLTRGPHTLKLTVSSQKNPVSIGTACRIVHFLVNK
ncbi:SGNH/GDSL hydrolase family protein [Mucilaginibacter sp. dw_454]|uniref:SGNH/GDSL hydrolase family protein n=1 Tax=Mucilaginibacter sp. dw_454 TaxID=2720079 RepID=UPI001BD664DC|nr:SGNH/GDSL hydrolase family protein [Mucilaginibacter sp. dw_454]